MSKIISSQGNEINFSLSGSRKVFISNEPIEVTESELLTLRTRLGSQIKEVMDTETIVTPEVAAEEVVITPETVPVKEAEVVEEVPTEEVVAEEVTE